MNSDSNALSGNASVSILYKMHSRLTEDSLSKMATVFLLLAFLAPLAYSAPQCKNHAGKDVEWYVIYKLPKTKPYAESTYIPDGGEMAYVDSTMKDAKGWILLKASVYDVKGNPVAETLGDLFTGSAPKDSLYAVYSDQPPEPYTGSAKGHTKGVVQFNKDKGFWLVHSVPRFPFNVTSKTYEYPESGRNNGQVFMCTSFKGNQLPKVALALRHQYPYIYESGAPEELLKDDDVINMMDKKFLRKPSTPVLTDTLIGSKGTEFTSFAKHQSLNDEIYANVIAPHLGANLIVETWRNGAGGKLDATCPIRGHHVTNMANVIIKFANGKQSVFTTTEDHAKWAVSADPKKPWFCAGSLNRMLSQYTRGGQTTCIQNKLLHKLFTDSVEKCQVCEGENEEKRYCKIKVTDE
ncbi:plancitoxin-1 [Galendromus occidentalis]|uniref:Plancitoxin-1 n=1 Tax=Galendromus occidentalis TaxID=34638 RepID=A0AAJ6VX19_9ACAR|nr:plancitoxin-1 [Galendromus occidentalis]